jgi:hypothetical protein
LRQGAGGRGQEAGGRRKEKEGGGRRSKNDAISFNFKLLPSNFYL